MFLSKILPSDGMYCVATLMPRGGFRHEFFTDIPDAQSRLDSLNAAGSTCYIAQATFDQDKIEAARKHNKALPKSLSKEEYKKQKRVIRGQENTKYLKNFFLDIDCGEKWPLKNQKEGVVALKKFITETELPFPAVVNSGNGLYAHWIMSEAVPAGQWRTIAFILKQVVAKYSPDIGGDSSRTADSASVLRAPGTTNRKPGKPAKAVTLLKDTDPILFKDFVDDLRKAAKKKHINTEVTEAPKPNTDLNQEFFCGLEIKSVPGNAHQIADSCAQLGVMRTTAGDIIEPLWYACIGLLVHCEDGESIIHEWSKGHPQYDSGETDTKIQQWKNAGIGPSTCANIGSISSAGCIGCKNNGKIKSPIVLGRPEPVKKETPVEQCEPPSGFRRTADGLFAEQDGRWIRFYDQDLYPERLAYDESLGYEVMTIKHILPYEGEMECTIRSSIVNDPKALINILSDNHIKVVGLREKKYMAQYLESYQAKLQRKRRMSMLLCQMGWKKSRSGKHMFVLGRKIFHADGTTEDASLAKNVPNAAEGYRSAGSLDRWAMATEVLNKPGMEPFAFALLAGGFGAPLMKFTGFDGAMVSLVGGTGAGKTLMLRWIQSVWGFHNDLMMLRDDTKNALVSRLGVYGNLPLTVDEVTNISGIELSDLVYRVTQGRDKARLTKNAEERKLLNAWNTVAVTSSNSSLVDKLSGTKHDASAEINRVFEYPVMENPEFKGQRTTSIYWLLHENYGHAGAAYVKWLVQNMGSIKDSLDKVRVRIDQDAEIKGDERFWGAVASTAIYGGLVAKKLGLIRFDVGRVMDWASDTIFNMRGDKNDLAGSSIDILGQFIDEYAASRLLVKGNARGALKCCIIEEPRGPLVMRYELDNHRLFLSRAVFKSWITKRFGSYTQIKNDLAVDRVLVNANKRKVLGAGTYYGGAQQVCWEINMKSSKLGRTVSNLVQTAESLGNDNDFKV